MEHDRGSRAAREEEAAIRQERSRLEARRQALEEQRSALEERRTRLAERARALHQELDRLDGLRSDYHRLEGEVEQHLGQADVLLDDIAARVHPLQETGDSSRLILTA